jgi:hypothetical protein
MGRWGEGGIMLLLSEMLNIRVEVEVSGGKSIPGVGTRYHVDTESAFGEFLRISQGRYCAAKAFNQQNHNH